MIFAFHGAGLVIDDALQAALHHRRNHRGERGGENRHAEYHHRYRKQARFWRARDDIAVTHGTHGDQGVIQRRDQILDRRREFLRPK